MSMDMHELEAESAELLPGREALGKLSVNIFKSVKVTNHVADVTAVNSSQAANYGSILSEAGSSAGQGISITQ
jgi:hypothetical protein